MNNLKINPVLEEKKITSFISDVLKTQGFDNVIIGLSGGIDSALSLSLVRKVVDPKNIFVAHLYYFKSQINSLLPFLKKANIPQKNIYNISIKNVVGQTAKAAGLTKNSKDYQTRLGNMMARTRMILLYDLAKKHQGLVCGTENKSELFLGYFTRFGDEASDFEPIQHLYKTQVYQLAKHLNIPEKIISQAPSAGLYDNQTDEKDFGFSYEEADKVLDIYLNNKKSVSKTILKNFPNAQKIFDWVNKNSFKHHLPHTIKQLTT